MGQPAKTLPLCSLAIAASCLPSANVVSHGTVFGPGYIILRLRPALQIASLLVMVLVLIAAAAHDVVVPLQYRKRVPEPLVVTCQPFVEKKPILNSYLGAAASLFSA